MSRNFLSLMLASGGDRRIAVPRGANTNKYGASPFPRSIAGYAASTANDISTDAFAHLKGLVDGWPAGHLLDARQYRDTLEGFRDRLRRCWSLGDGTAIVFAPSGTDLEYVALALAAARANGPVTNLLLGPDEVGSGCALAAEGRYFADETAVCPIVPKGARLAGLEGAKVMTLPVRREDGSAIDSGSVAATLGHAAEVAKADGTHTIVHVVHGSKTGLVLPELSDLDRFLARHGNHCTIVVDACQARIEADAIRAYLRRGAIVLLTGSKFIGGPPFSGMALVPESLPPDRSLPPGLGTVFRRGEWPVDWHACDGLPNETNPGLVLRLAAALFELERYLAIAAEGRDLVIAEFGGAVRRLGDILGARLVAPGLDGPALHRATFATLDLSGLPSRPGIATAERWHKVLAARGLRLGQPVKCIRRADGEWAGTLRLSLSMPLIHSLAHFGQAAVRHRFDSDMDRIAQVLHAAQRPVVA